MMSGARTVMAVWIALGAAAGGFGLVWGAGPAGAAAAGPRPAPSAPAAGPSALAETAVVSVGQKIRVQGSGWGSDTSQVVSVVLCGNAALDGAADCDLGATAEGGLRAEGTFSALFTVPAPPLPCPCLLRFFSPAAAVDVKLPVTVLGAATAPPRPQVSTRRSVRVDGVHFEGRGAWTAWFGAPAERTLVYRVTNTGDVVLHDPAVDAVSGRGPHPDGFVAVPPVGDLAVGAVRTFRVPVRFSALSLGTYRAVVTVDPFGTTGTGGADTGLTPWGLVAVGGGVPVLALVRRRTARRRYAITRVAVAASGAAAASAAPGWYHDPISPAALRLWDGRGWTESTQPTGAGAAAGAAAGAEPVPEVRRQRGPLTLVLEDAS